MKPVNLTAKLAAAETELACVRMVLAHVKLDRDELRQERDEWRREAEMLGAAKLIIAKLRVKLSGEVFRPALDTLPHAHAREGFGGLPPSPPRIVSTSAYRPQARRSSSVRKFRPQNIDADMMQECG